MQSTAGAIVVLAGAMALGLGAIASAIRTNLNEAVVTMVVGGFLVAFGIVILLLGFVTGSKPKS